jgi:hypothetical protein
LIASLMTIKEGIIAIKSIIAIGACGHFFGLYDASNLCFWR